MTAYLDYNATAPLAPEAREAMEPYLSRAFGNPASVHAVGQRARAAVDRAREQVRALAGGEGGEVLFTSSGTEAVVTAIVCGCRSRPDRRHLVVSAVEHTAGMDATRVLEEAGWNVSRVFPGANGRVDAEAVAREIREDTALVSVLHANNETGVIQDVGAMARDARAAGALFHTDAVQSAGKIRVEAERWGADLVSLAAHKLGGPQGVGALWLRRGLRLPPLIPGTQELGMRGGTSNVAGIVGFGAAAERAIASLDPSAARCRGLRDRLEAKVVDSVRSARVTGRDAPRLPNTSHFTFEGDPGQDLVLALDLAGFAVSKGSACKSGSVAASHVLLAMGMSPERAGTAVRASVGGGTTEAEVDAFALALSRIAGRTG